MGDQLVPVLRFKDFNGSWDKIPFDDAVEIVKGLVDPKIEPYASMPHIGQGNISSMTGALLNYNTAKEDQQTSGKYLFNENHVIYGKINPQLGKVVHPKFKGLCSADSYPMKGKDGILIATFLKNLLMHKSFFQYSVSVSKRTGIPKINRDELSAFSFVLPEISEQQKIADFLSSVDKKIEQLTRKKELLEKYKTGMMQKLFPKAGEQHPELRFKDENGQDFPDWSTSLLGNRFSIKMCKRIFTDQTSHSGEIPFYTIGTLGSEADKFISRELFEEYRYKYNYPKIGETLITCSGTIGKTVQFDGIDAYYQDSNIVWIQNNEDFITNDFAYILIRKNNWNRLSSTTITRLYTSDLKQIKLCYPVIPEQKKIADFLSAIDDKITKVEGKLTKAQTFKKGLLQQMFV